MKLIVACTPDGGIGYNNKLPWSKIQGDLPRFKSLTDNQIVVMGRNTWNSLPKKPLINRTNLILTSTVITNLPNDTFTVSTLEKVNKDAWIIGGANVINTNWHFIDEVHLTRIIAKYTCDTFIDLIKLETEFICWFKEKYIDHTYEIWKRK